MFDAGHLRIPSPVCARRIEEVHLYLPVDHIKDHLVRRPREDVHSVSPQLTQ